jgi:hypothetical protein
MQLARVVMVAAWLVLGVSAQAEVFKCKGADGKLVFSDHACTADQTGSSMSGIPKSPPKTALPAEPTTALDQAKRQQMQAGLSPECQALGDKASQLLRSEAGLEEIKRAVSAFEGRCGDQVEKAWRASGQARPTSLKPDAASCRTLRQALTDAKAQLPKMTDKEKMEYAKLHNEVSVACP